MKKKVRPPPQRRKRYSLFFVYAFLRDNGLLGNFKGVILTLYYDSIVLIINENKIYNEFITLNRTGLRSYFLFYSGSYVHFNTVKELIEYLKKLLEEIY